MILQVFICLLLMSLYPLLITQGRRRKIWSAILLIGLSAASYFFVINLNTQPQDSFIYQWLPYELLKADFRISASQNVQNMLKPLIIMLLGLVYLNTIYKGEQHSLHFNTLLILNFVALILMLSSHDFFQLMFAGCMFSVIGFYMPDISAPRKTLFIFYFFAETSIFIALSVVYGSIHSISLADMDMFLSKGQHKDIVSGLLLFAIACKSGLFLFSSQYFNLKQISSNRIICIMLTSVPISAMVLLIKIKPLLTATSLAPSILPWWIYVSVFSYLLIYLFNNNIKSKIISIMMAGIAASLHFIYVNSAFLYDLVPYILCVAFLISMTLVIIFNSTPKESDITYIRGYWRITKLNFVICLLLGVTSIAILARFPLNIYETVYVSCFLAVTFAVFRRVFFAGHGNAITLLSNTHNANLLYILPLVVISIWFLWQTNFWKYEQFYILQTVCFIMLFLPITKWIDVISKLKIWDVAFFDTFYENIFVHPLKLFGRILWLSFDVVVVERSIIASISQLSKNFVGELHKIQENRKYGYILSVASGFLIIIIYFFRNIYK